jgi:hypothetical protein
MDVVELNPLPEDEYKEFDIEIIKSTNRTCEFIMCLKKADYTINRIQVCRTHCQNYIANLKSAESRQYKIKRRIKY